MKKLTLLLLFLASMLSSYGQLKAPAAKQRKVYINLIDGTRQSFNIWQVDSITFGYDEDDSLKADIISKPVDLGLSVKWASFNVGATDSLSVGYLVGWGDATGLNRSLSLEYYPTLNPKGNIINTENDLAKVMWEDQWRMPTEGEIQELVDSCDWTYVHEGDARGYLVKSRKNENSIFLPLTGKREGSDDDVTDKNIGFYWSGILAENKDNAVMLSIRESGRNTTEMLRSTGLAIRPVYGDYRQKVEVSFDEGNVKKDKTSATFPLNFTGSLSFVTEYGVAYATSEATLDVQGNSKVKVTGEPKEAETIKVTGLEPNTTYYFKAYAITEGNYTESEVFTITTDAKFPIPEAVDLGLSVRWAKWNMGASSEYDSGDWYGWGDPTGEKTSTISSDYANGYNKPSICGTSLDIATQNWGEGWRLPTAEEVKELLDTYRKKYYDARHVCYAYMLGPERTEFRANDDGEPSSTAGKPILGQINSNELTDILIVVVRYYGGVNLGTSGLIVAYREAAADAIAHCTVETRQVEEVVSYSFAYPMMNDVMRIVKDMAPRIVSQTYDNTCEIRLAIRKSEAEQLRQRLAKLSFQ